MTDHSHEPAHFQKLYEASPDPWHYHDSAYEIAKRDATVAALGDRRFVAALEVGCAIGVLTRQLAAHCDRVLGVDFVPQALDTARATCAGLPNVSFRAVRVPAEWPDGAFDLIVLSEVLYFLSDADNAALAALCHGCLAPGGEILLVNWLEKSSDDPCSGDDAAKRFIDRAAPWSVVSFQRRTDRYRIDRLSPRD